MNKLKLAIFKELRRDMQVIDNQEEVASNRAAYDMLCLVRVLNAAGMFSKFERWLQHEQKRKN